MSIKTSLLTQALTNNAMSYGNRLQREQDETDELSNDPFESVARMRTRYQEVGEAPPENKPRKNLLQTAINVLDAPGNAVRGAIQEGLNSGGPSGFEGLWKGLIHKEQYSTQDWMRRAGLPDTISGVGGFIGDVLLDPTTYIGGGAIKQFGAGAMKGVGKKAGQEALESLGTKLATKLGASADDIAKQLAKRGVTQGDDLFEAGAKILKGADPTTANITGMAKTAQETAEAARKASQSAGSTLRSTVGGILGDSKGVTNEMAEKLTNVLEIDPLAKPDTLAKILGKTDAPKGSKDWNKIYQAFDSRFQTHIARSAGDDAAKAARDTLRSMTPEQLNTAFNVADEMGAQIVSAQKVDTYNRLMNVVRAYSDPNKLKNAVDARNAYRTTVTEMGDALFEVDLANGLKVAMNALGQRRIVGIQLPFSKNITPLADITRVVNKFDKPRTAIYNNVPGVKFISDWWDKAIRGEVTWGLQQEQMAGQFAGIKEATSRYTRLKGSLPMQMEGFIKNMFGAEFMTPQYNKVQRALPYVIEGTMDLPDHSMAHKYMLAKIAPQYFDADTLADEIATFAADINNPNVLKLLDDRAASIGVLTDEELALTQKMMNKLKVSNDALFELEDVLGYVEPDVDGAPRKYKAGGAQREDYIYHVYANNGKKGGPGSKMRGVQAKQSAEIVTTGNTSMFHSREYPTIAHAIASGNGLDPIDNVITIQAMRMAETVKHGIHKSVIDGIDNVFAMTDDVRKALELDELAPLTKETLSTVADTRSYPMTPAEIAKRNAKLTKDKTALAQQLQDLEAQVKGVKYDDAKFTKTLQRDQATLARVQKELARTDISAEQRAKLEARVAAIQKHADSVQRAIDDVHSGKIKPKRGRPTAEQQAIRDEYILNTARRPETAIWHSPAGDIEVEVTYAGMTGVDDHYFNIKGSKTPVSADELEFTPRPADTGIKPWEDYRVDLEFTPKQADTYAKNTQRMSELDAALGEANPQKTRTFQRVQRDYVDIEGAAREEALAARGAVEATLRTFEEAVGSGEGMRAFKDLFRRVDDLPVSARVGGDKEFVAVGKLFGLNEHYLVHKDVYPLMEQFEAKMVNGDSLNELLDVYDTAVRYLKTMQTTLNPSFVPRNLIGEATMSVLHGTSVQAFQTGQKVFEMLGGYTQVGSTKMFNTEAVLKLQLLRPHDMVTVNGVQKTAKKAVDDLIASLSVDIGGKPVYIEELFANFIRTGLGQAGMLTETLSDNIPRVVEKLEHRGAVRTAANTFTQDLRGKKVSENFAVALPKLYKNLMRAGSEWTEQSFRLADFIHDLGRGMDWDEAAKQVKMYHVDYADLTAFEKTVMRRAVPYYTFMRKNIPMQLRLLVERPGYYTAVGHLIGNASAGLDNPTAPDYLTENMALPLFEDDDGTVTYLNWNLPLTDLARFTNDFQENMKGAVGSLTPFLRVPFEMATGETMMFGGKIDDPLKYIAGNLGGVNVLYKMLAGANAPDGTGTYSRPGQVGAYGSLLPRVNPSLEELKKMYAYRDKIQEDMKKRKDRGEPIPAITETQAGSYERSRAYEENKRTYTAPHER